MKFKNLQIGVLSALITLSACRKDEDPQVENLNTVPEFFAPAEPGVYGSVSPSLDVVASSGQKVNIPQDLDFHPTRNMELWVLNKDMEQSGGSTVTIRNAGKGDQESEWRRDGNAWHFMALPSAIAFSNNGNFSTTANIKDANHGTGTYTGPSLWSSDMNIYAKPSGGNGSHLDMLHGSPYSMGIAAESDNAFWVYDSYYGHLVRYDFVDDHGPGNDDHSDARVRRYKDVALERYADGVPCHMVLDADKKWLYIVDGPKGRIIRVNIQTGSNKGNLPLINEQLAEHSEIEGAVVEVMFQSGFQQPAGIEIKDNRIFVSDYKTGDIIAFDINSKQEIGRIATGNAGVVGIKVGPEGRLWYVNAQTNEVVRVSPK